jgi:hypothetical protein
MKRFTWAALAAVVVGGWLAGTASAQLGGYQRPYQNPYPTFSPILNMNGFNNPAINYFGIVRPQMQTTAALQQLQTNQQFLLGAQTAYQQMPAQPLLDGQQPLVTTGQGVGFNFSTGHSVGFNDYTRYFPLQGFRTGTGMPATGMPTTGGGGYFPTGGFGMQRR